MKPEDTYVMQEIMQKMLTKDYTFTPEYDDLIKTVVHKMHDGSMNQSIDLSHVSTRNLLNECYRRRAIEKFTYRVDADMYFLKQEPKARDHLIRELIQAMWGCMLKNEKFSRDAIDITEQVNNSQIRTEFTGEVYICKHPNSLKR